MHLVRCITGRREREHRGAAADPADGCGAAFSAIEARESKIDGVRRQIELALEQACYESNRTQRQYHAVDPENRIVAAELEWLWNERLLVVRELQIKLQQVDTQRLPPGGTRSC